MVARLALIVLFGCGTTTTSRTGVCAAPGGPIFTFVRKLHTETSSGPTLEKEGIGWSSGTYGIIHDAWVIATDPFTNAHVQLGSITSAMHPFYWDNHRKILWVQTPRGGTRSDKLVGLVPGGVVFLRDDERISIWQDLPAPFVRVVWDNAPVDKLPDTILNVATGELLRGFGHVHHDSTWYYQAPILRAVTRPLRPGSGRVQGQDPDESRLIVTTVDWSKLTVDVQRWLPTSDPSEGVARDAVITGDGRYYVELLERADRLALRITAIEGAPSRIIVLEDAWQPDESRWVELRSFSEDVVIVSYPGPRKQPTTDTLESLDQPCTSGHVIRSGSALHTRYGPEVCIERSSRDGYAWTHRPPMIEGSREQYVLVNERAELVSIGKVATGPYRSGPREVVAMRARPTGKLEWVRIDLTTGEQRPTSELDAQPRTRWAGDDIAGCVPLTQSRGKGDRASVPSWTTGGRPIELPKNKVGPTTGIRFDWSDGRVIHE